MVSGTLAAAAVALGCAVALPGLRVLVRRVDRSIDRAFPETRPWH